MKKLWLFALLILQTAFLTAAAENAEFVVVIPSYNNAKCCVSNLESLAKQCYPYWQAIYIDDCSSDDTGELVKEFIKKHHLEKKIRYVRNKKNIGAMANFYHWINQVDEKKIIVHLDGDDRLAHPMVLEKLAYTYADKKVWLTYGNFRSEPENFPFRSSELPKKIIKKNRFRKYHWVTSHLKTYYAKLFHQIKKKDLTYKGKFVPMASDAAIMFCLLELSSNDHIRFLNEELYIYNYTNPLNDEKINLQLVQDIDKNLRKKKGYKPLKNLF